MPSIKPAIAKPLSFFLSPSAPNIMARGPKINAPAKSPTKPHAKDAIPQPDPLPEAVEIGVITLSTCSCDDKFALFHDKI